MHGRAIRLSAGTGFGGWSLRGRCVRSAGLIEFTGDFFMQVVWYKRDLRIRDHRPLAAACRRGGPVLCLYVVEPELWQQPDADARHWHFIRDSLTELDAALRQRGAELIIRVGDVIDVLSELHRTRRLTELHSHEETGTLWTYDRDRRVGRWCREHGVRRTEHVQSGVFRRLKSRDGWAARRSARLSEPVTAPPKNIPTIPGPVTEDLPDVGDLGLTNTAELHALQRGGETLAWQTLRSFLTVRGHNYHREMSSPVTAPVSCSRLSPHLAWGTISMRAVHQVVQERLRGMRLRQGSRQNRHGVSGSPALKAFLERLSWHCHFIQKLEDQPDLERVNMHRACDGLRPDEPDPVRFAAWRDGKTGFPLVDACMRSVRATGWLNFRMRAMVVSFASYHLWLDWRKTGLHLARMFTDYEPGIHFSQMQMQSGTTGISALRIYNPIRQVAEQDPQGTFIRQWVPELKNVPSVFLAEPHRMPREVQLRSGCVIGQDYPHPIVDQQSAAGEARVRIEAVRASESSRREASSVFRQHGSRRGPRDRAARQRRR